jgi:DNA polymerase I
MIRIARVIEKEKLQSRMLLQVHDELVFEAPPQEKDKLQQLVKTEMEAVHELSVPLLVEVGSGPNWRDAK